MHKTKTPVVHSVHKMAGEKQTFAENASWENMHILATKFKARSLKTIFTWSIQNNAQAQFIAQLWPQSPADIFTDFSDIKHGGIQSSFFPVVRATFFEQSAFLWLQTSWPEPLLFNQTGFAGWFCLLLPCPPSTEARKKGHRNFFVSKLQFCLPGGPSPPSLPPPSRDDSCFGLRHKFREKTLRNEAKQNQCSHNTSDFFYFARFISGMEVLPFYCIQIKVLSLYFLWHVSYIKHTCNWKSGDCGKEDREREKTKETPTFFFFWVIFSRAADSDRRNNAINFAEMLHLYGGKSCIGRDFAISRKIILVDGFLFFCKLPSTVVIGR